MGRLQAGEAGWENDLSIVLNTFDKLPIRIRTTSTLPFIQCKAHHNDNFHLKIGQIKINIVYNNEYTSIIDIYFYEFFQPFSTSSACAPKHLRHPVRHFGKCLCFSLIKIEPVSINPSQAGLSLFFSIVYSFLLK